MFVALAFLVGVGVFVWLSLASGEGANAQGAVSVVDNGRTLLVRDVDDLRHLDDRELRDWLERVPERQVRRRGVAELRSVLRRYVLERRVRDAIRTGGGTVAVPWRTLAASARLPIYRQELRNNCETAALSMLLTARAVRRAQLRLQGELPRSRPIDPEISRDGATIWGDPRRGFVGRPGGSGPAGGYGVYAGPIAALARRHGVVLRSLSRHRAAAVYSSLLEGRPVMVWVGLTDGLSRLGAPLLAQL